MKIKERKLCQGLTVVEALVILAVLAVLAAFTNPILRDHSARAAVEEAAVQVGLALHNAKNLARDNNTTITVLFTTNPSDNTISFEFPPDSQGTGGRLTPPAGVTLPDSVSVSSDVRTLTFGPRGIVNATDSVELALAAGTDFFARVTLNPVQNRVKTSYGLQAVSE